MADVSARSYLEHFYRTHVFSGGVDGQVLVQDSASATGAGWSAAPALTDLTFTGQVKAADGAVGAPSYAFSGELTTGMYRGGAGDLRFSAAGGDKLRIAGTQVVVASSGLLAWGSSGISTADLFLTRDAANTFAQRNSTTAQAFRVYNTFTDSSNYERLDINWASNIVRIKSAAAGTGTSRAMELGTLGTAGVFIQTNGTNRWQIDGSNGHLLASTDNSWDIGASGATRPRDYYGAGKITSAGATAGLGYATGAGGTVIQATSKVTGVTLSKVSGQITLNAAALAADTTASFTLTNTAIAATDVLILNHISGGTAGAYTLNAQAAAGTASINVRNITAGSLSEAIVIQFVVIKGVTS